VVDGGYAVIVARHRIRSIRILEEANCYEGGEE